MPRKPVTLVWPAAARFLGLAWVWAIALGGLAGGAAGDDAAKDLQSLVNEAIAAYDAGEFERSVRLFENARSEQPANGHLLYNLAHAYYKAGREGEAVAAFLAAHRYLPRDPDVRANLDFLAEKLEVPQASDPRPRGIASFWSWVDWFTPREWLVAAGVAALLSGLALLVVFGLPRFFAYRRIALGTLVLPLGFALLGATAWEQEQTWGAVVNEEAAVRSSPSETAAVRFRLARGAPLRIVYDGGRDYLRVRTGEGREGWLPRRVVAVY